jgi:transcriptional regulator with XRE-family HTH domain
VTPSACRDKYRPLISYVSAFPCSLDAAQRTSCGRAVLVSCNLHLCSTALVEPVSDESLVRLGAELRRIREDAGLSGSEVARAIGWSQPKVSRVETGRFGASLGEVAALLDYYAVPEEVRAELLARTARHDGLEGAWVVRAGGVRRRQAEVGTIESRVSLLRQYQALTVPGLLQSPSYTRAVALAGGFDDAVSIAQRRASRQHAFHAREDVQYQVVLDARALLRWPGGASVMAEQLEQLIGLDRTRVDLRILPLGGSSHAVAMGSFLIYEFAEARPTIVLSEAQTADLYLSADADVQAYAELFAKLQQEALGPRASKAHLERTLRDVRSAANKKGK